MDKDISGDCRGDFGDLVMELCKGEREPGSEVNKEQAKSDAKELYKVKLYESFCHCLFELCKHRAHNSLRDRTIK